MGARPRGSKPHVLNDPYGKSEVYGVPVCSLCHVLSAKYIRHDLCGSVISTKLSADDKRQDQEHLRLQYKCSYSAVHLPYITCNCMLEKGPHTIYFVAFLHLVTHRA